MNKGFKFLSKALAYSPLILFGVIGFISMHGLESFVYLGLGLIIYFIVGFGLTSEHKEYQLAGLLSLFILTVVFYLGESEVFGSSLTILYIWLYYALVYGVSRWVQKRSHEGGSR